MKPEMQPISPPERSRTYLFPGDETVTIADVKELAVSASGTHRIRTCDGKLHIVPTGWLHITIDADDWSL